MNALKAILTIILALFCVACSADGKDSFSAQYWSTFRQAILDNNNEKIVTMVRFPFEVRGPDDSDPVVHYDREGFRAIYERLLAQPVYLPYDGRIMSKSMRQLIGEKKEISSADYLTSDSIQIHQFEIRRIEGTWYFTRAYLEE